MVKKECSCGHRFSEDSWVGLRLVGTMDNGRDAGELLETRVCSSCGSSLSVPLGVHAPTSVSPLLFRRPRRPEKGAVLLIEDDTDIAEIVRDVLLGEGYDVHHAGNGAEGLELLHGGLVPGVILLDLMMPVMDGAEFREKQLAEVAIARIPVVIVSVYPIRSSFGRVYYLRKPFSPEQLLAVVDEAIRGGPRREGLRSW